MIRYSSPKPWLLAIALALAIWIGAIALVLWLAEVIE